MAGFALYIRLNQNHIVKIDIITSINLWDILTRNAL